MQLGASRPLLIIKYYWGDQIKEDEMGSACDTCGRGEIQDFDGDN